VSVFCVTTTGAVDRTESAELRQWCLAHLERYAHCQQLHSALRQSPLTFFAVFIRNQLMLLLLLLMYTVVMLIADVQTTVWRSVASCVTVDIAVNETLGGGKVAPERIWKRGGAHPARNTGKFFLSWSSTFLALQVCLQLVVLVSSFVMVTTVWSVSRLLFVYSQCLRAQPFLKVGARVPCALWSRRHCIGWPQK